VRNEARILALSALCLLPAVADAAAGQTEGRPTISARVSVPAQPPHWRRDVLTRTKIAVKAGDTLQFAATGLWYLGVPTPKGEREVPVEGFDTLCRCLVSEPVGDGHFHGALGALVGRIGERGTPFLIGEHRTVEVHEAGVLYLGANDNMEPCKGSKRAGSCYADNDDSVMVSVVLHPADPW